MDTNTLIQKVAWIISEHEDRVRWDIPKSILVEELVLAYEKLADEKEVVLYER